MPTLVFLPHEQICPEGKTIQVEPGITICDAALQNGIPIEHACEKSCACTTCHVHVRLGLEALEDATEDEEDYLDKALTSPLNGDNVLKSSEVYKVKNIIQSWEALLNEF